MSKQLSHERSFSRSEPTETPSNDLDLPEGVPLNGNRDDDGISSHGSEEEGASALSSVFTLCNSCIGAGVLSLPFAFMKAGEVHALTCFRFSSISSWSMDWVKSPS